MASQIQQEVVELYVPQLREEHKIACYAQLRPFREGGPRIERQTIQGKNFIHNYGHGGAGISLAPATSHQAIQLAAPLISSAPQVAIIGSGVVGLLTAYLLKQRFRQAKVMVYAQQIPRFGNKDNRELITSEIAPGYWLPYDYGLKDREYHNKLSNFAFQWYQNLAKNHKFQQIVREVEVYSLSDSGQYQQESKLTDNLKHSSKYIDVRLNGTTKAKAHVIKTLKIDMQPFLNLIMQQLTSMSVSFVVKKITRDNLLRLNQNIIFNCAGLGSRDLFGDTKMKGLKGHIIEYKNIMPQKYNYFLKVSLGNKHAAYYMHSSRILVGRVVEQEQTRTVNSQVVKEIQNIHEKVLESYGLKQAKPKL